MMMVVSRVRRAMLSGASVRAVAVASALLFVPAAAWAQEGVPAVPALPAITPAFEAAPVVAAPAPIDPTTVVATVNGVNITQADLQAMATQFGDALAQYAPEERRPALLEAAINVQLMAQAGVGIGLDQTPDFIEQMRLLRERVLQNAYLQTVIESQITEEALTAKYDELVSQLNLPTQVHIRHIVVATEAEANEIISLLNSGAIDFESMAQTRSLDTTTGAEGGDLGFWGPGELIVELDDVIFTIPPGEVGQVPVQTQFGWHVIKVDEARTQPPPSFEETRDQIRDILYQELFNAEVARLTAEATIEIVGATPAAPAALPETPAAPAPEATPAPAPEAAPAPAPAPEAAPAPAPEATPAPAPAPEATPVPEPTPAPAPEATPAPAP